ncbi:MAG: hypothetical protein IT385_23125 [Deltaproteobacteria bacterium]|nr:hypothetical protein [Deltaproteobacteria bacterium]
MDDESFEGHQNGRPRRHDGRDPWSFVSRERVGATPPGTTSADLTVAPPEPQPGDVIVVVIERERQDAQGRYEELWLEVEAVDGDTITALFDSQPTYVRGISAGDRTTLPRACALAVRRPRGAEVGDAR